MQDQEHLQALRRHEAEGALRFLPAGARVLEIGAGAGWQSRMFSELGFDVSAIDLESSQYRQQAVFDVKTYDGHRIPFGDASFDVVFSSNVLEHIPHVEEFQAEILRVLAPGGRAVHILPSASWRLWTTLTYYLTLPVRLLRRLARRSEPRSDPQFWEEVAEETGIDQMDLIEFAEFVADDPQAAEPRPEFVEQLRIRLKELQRVTPPPHGEFGNFATEIYYFSRFRWKALFEREGFRVVASFRNGLFYTGYSLLGARLAIRVRSRLSRLLGSACRVYVLERS